MKRYKNVIGARNIFQDKQILICTKLNPVKIDQSEIDMKAEIIM
jgi:hypothetical protein